MFILGIDFVVESPRSCVYLSLKLWICGSLCVVPQASYFGIAKAYISQFFVCNEDQRLVGFRRFSTYTLPACPSILHNKRRLRVEKFPNRQLLRLEYFN